MAAIPEILSIVFGSSGAATVAFESIREFVRRPSKAEARIRVQSGSQILEIRAHHGNEAEVSELVKILLEDLSDQSDSGS